MRGVTTRGSWASSVGGVVLLCILLTALQLAPVMPMPPRVQVSPTNACEEFLSRADGFAWDQDDCEYVWSQWETTVGGALHRAYQDRHILRGIADEMRQRRTPCLVKAGDAGDGVGSATMRHIATWVLARDIGCDWVKPQWGRPMGNDTTMYCHTKKPFGETLESMSAKQVKDLRICRVVSWLYFFHFDIPSVDYPKSIVARTVSIDPLNPTQLAAAVDEAVQNGLDDVPWDTLVLQVTPSMASRYMLAVGGWDSLKRVIFRELIQEMRKNFHEYPRPWFDPQPACLFDAALLNFALHVRMGDRRLIQAAPDSYFDMLEDLMGNITDSVLKRRLAPPLFHVFTETLRPCPSEETGVFDEFPTWPVELSQIPACVNEEPWADCPKTKDGTCTPTRSGAFRVANKPIIIHIGEDVVSALSCMALADGIVMGCSSFGQIAGLLSHGISMFSVRCDGDRTPAQYKAIPPMAIAERGEMWVPIEGSWHDPRLYSLELFDRVLDQHLGMRR